MEENLSQEEVNKRIEMMKENCLFCKIIKTEIPSKIIFEDDLCMAFLDINPFSIGHMVLVPKEHFMIMQAVPNEVMGHLGIISKSLCNLLNKTYNPKNVEVFIANGNGAGQQVGHFCMHIIPIYEDSNLDFTTKSDVKLNEKELLELTEKLKKKLIEVNSKV